MKKHLALAAFLSAVLFLFSSCSGSPDTQPEVPETKENDKEIKILFTNDVHCGVSGEIGYAGISAVKKQTAEAGNYVALVDVGDNVQGDTIGSISEGENIVRLMNAVGYDVAIPGNHEFDYNMSRFLELTTMADYPYLSCNILDTETGDRILDAYKILEFGSFKIGFVGVTTPNTVTSSSPKRFKDETGKIRYSFMRDEDGTALYTAIQEAVDAVRAQGADYVVVLGHLGIDAVDSPWTSSEVITHTNGIDVLLDGHSHSVLNEKVRNKDGKTVLLAQTGTKLDRYGCLTVSRTGELSVDLIEEVSGKDDAIDSMIADMSAQFEEEMKKVIATTAFDLTIMQPDTDPAVRIVRRAETNLADLIADAFRVYAQADIGLINGGGVRASLPAGEITYGGLQAVLPFGNLTCVIEATGQQILDALENGVIGLPEESGGFMHVSGMTYQIDVSVPSHVVKDENGMFVSVDGEYRVKNVTVGGEPLDLAKTYTVASINYILLEQGDGRTMFDGCRVLLQTGLTDFDIVADYIMNQMNGTVSDAYADPFGDGRIIAIE